MTHHNVTRRGDPDAIVMQLDSRRSRGKPRPGPKWRRLTDYFVASWEQVVLERPELRDVRCLETVGHCRRYFERHLANQDEPTVRRYISEFMRAVASGELTVKPGQSVWMRFTGAWGR